MLGRRERIADLHLPTSSCGDQDLDGPGLILVDVVTTRHHDLHYQLLDLLEVEAPRADEVDPLYAVAYRTQQEEATRLSIWRRRLVVGSALPTLPLWLSPDLVVPVGLALSYRAACELLRIPPLP